MKPNKAIRLVKAVTYQQVVYIQVDWQAPVAFYVEWEKDQEVGPLLQWRFIYQEDRRRFMALEVRDQLSLYARLMDPGHLKEVIENQSYG